MRLWGTSSLSTKEVRKFKAGRRALSVCDNISQLWSPSFSGWANTGLSQGPQGLSWSLLLFSLGTGVFQASQRDPTKIPTSQTEEAFEGQKLGFASKAGMVVCGYVSRSRSCGCVLLCLLCCLCHAEEPDSSATLWRHMFPQCLNSIFSAALLGLALPVLDWPATKELLCSWENLLLKIIFQADYSILSFKGQTWLYYN